MRPLRASGGILSATWSGLERLWVSWEGLGGLLGRSWSLLGALGAVLGPLGVVSWGHVGIR